MLEKFAKIFKLRKYKAPGPVSRPSTIVAKAAYEDRVAFSDFVPALGEPIFDEANNCLYVGQRAMRAGGLMYDSKAVPAAASNRLLPIKDIKPIGYVAPNRFVANIKIDNQWLSKTSEGLVNIPIPTVQVAKLSAGWSVGDINHDGVFDPSDYSLLKQVYFSKNISDIDTISFLMSKYSSENIYNVLDVDRRGYHGTNPDVIDYLILKRAYAGTATFLPTNVLDPINADPTKNWVPYSISETNEFGVFMDIEIKRHDRSASGESDASSYLIIRSASLSGATIDFAENQPVGNADRGLEVGTKKYFRIKRQFCPIEDSSIIILRNIIPAGSDINNLPDSNLLIV